MMLTLVREQQHCPELEMSFALCFDGRLSAELNASGSTVHSLGAVRIREPLSIKRARGNLKDLLQKEKFDVAVTHSCWAHSIFGPTIRAASVPLAFQMHAPATGKHWLERLARRIVPDKVLCNSEFTAATVGRLYPNRSAEVVYCPVSSPSRQYSQADKAERRAQLNTPTEATVIIQVGRMESGKGHLLHLEALSRLREVPGWVCWQIGGAQRPHEVRYLDELKKTSVRLGIGDRVQFLGERSDVSALLSAADIYCQPNTSPDSFGITLIEALYAGLPVVTTNLGGPREIVDDSCGILVPPDDKPALAETLRRLIDDSTLRKQLGVAGPTRSKALCDPNRQMNRIYEQLSDLRKLLFAPRRAQQLARAFLPRTARNWLRSPTTSAKWLWDGVKFSVGLKETIEIRPQWSLTCHPAAFRCAYSAQQNDPEQVLEFDAFIDYSTPGMVFFDIGAHFGLFSLAALHYGGPNATAVAIDPSPMATSFINIQAKLNHVEDRLRVIQAAVSDKRGRQKMVAVGVLANGYYVAPVENYPSSEMSQTDSVTLDQIIDQLKLTPTHIKIDVEGFEEAVLRGGHLTLSRDPGRPLLFIELHNEIVRAQGRRPENTLALLREYGYDTFMPTGVSISEERILKEPLIRVIAKKKTSR